MKIVTRHQALHLIKPYLPENPLLLEAGAFKGEDSLYMARLFPSASIHLFEPVPELFELLTENIRNLSTIQCWQLALSDTSGVTRFYVAEKKEKPGIPTQAGSLLSPKERLRASSIIYPRTIEVPTITLDAWAEQQQINRLDFLWLDAQGHELAILKGGQQILATVTALLVELHFIQAYEGQPLAQEIISWLDTQGFTMIARDYTEQPSWFFGNGLFVRTSVIDL